MDLRLTLLDVAARHGLDAATRQRLLGWAMLGEAPAALHRRSAQGVGVLAAALVGLAVVFAVAANWSSMDRATQFRLLQGAVLVPALAAWGLPGLARASAALLAFLATGALFAFFGQTYQTGADAWQLFALWAALGLPLALAVRHDVLWAPWALVIMTAAALWTRTHTAHRWRFEAQDLQPQLIAWAVCALLVLLLSPPARRFTGAGVWSLRTAVTAAAFVIAGTALGGLLRESASAQYPLGLLVLAGGILWLASPRGFDLFGVSALVLALDGLLVAGLVRALTSGSSRVDPMGLLLVVGLSAAGVLAVSVSQVLKLSRRRRDGGTA